MWRWFLTVLSWAHLHLVEPIVRWWEEVVLGSWEEWLLALVRQAFEETTRFLNFVGAWLLDLINKQRYREHLRSAWQDNSWQQWWGEVASRPSTLNALVARVVAQQDKQAQQQAAAQGPHSGANGTAETGSSNSQAAGFANGNGSLLSPAPSPPPAHWWSRGQPQTPSPAAPGAGSGAGVGAPGSSLAGAGRSGSGGGLPAAGPPPPLPPRTERPVVFTPARYGMGLLDELAKRRQGLIEEAKMAAQLAVSRAFEFLRRLVRTVFLLPPREGEEGYGPATEPPSRAHSSAPSAASGAFSSGPGPSGADDGASEAGTSGRGVRWRLAEAEAEGEGGASRSGRSGGGPSSGSRRGWGGHGAGAVAGGGSGRRSLHRSKSAHVDMAGMDRQPGTSAGAPSAAMARRGLRRSRSSGRPLGGAADVWGHHATDIPSDALSVIRAAGYPHELHTVTTSDGYLLRLERIPRPGARDTVFFMHGVLDTSMAWVSGGVTGSQAFAAWEAGMDVWLGNSRGNAPRQHQDPSRRGGFSYWRYNINHMGMYDIAAQLDHIHNVKCAELGAGTVTLDLDHLGPLAGSFFRPTPGPASGLGGSGPLPASAAGAGRGLPGRMASAAAAAPGSGAQDGSAGGQRTPPSAQGSRMRSSNSDGNLHRWGSLHSAASGGSAGGGGGAAGAAGGAAAEAGAGAGAGSGGRPQGAPPVPAQGAQGPPRLSPLPSSAEGSAREGEGSERSGGSDGDGEGGAGPRQGPGPEAGPATAPATAPGSGSGRAGGVRSRAVTLAVRGQGPGGEGRGLSGEGAGGEGAAGAGARTFTLAAKTRTDFGRGASLDGGPRPLPAPLEPPPVVGGGGGGVAGSAAAMLDAVGFVLGPAAGAVSHAMTAAAATAGAAAATAGAALATAAASAAASAAHLMQPSHSASSRPASPVRPAAVPAAPAAAASPFAAAPAQVLAAAAGAGADVEGAPLDEGGAEALPAGASAAGSAARVVEGWLGVARGLGWASPVRGAAAAPASAASAPQPGKGGPPCPCPEEAAVADARETSELAAAAAEAAAVAAAAAAAGSGSSPFASATSSAPDDSGGGRDGSDGARADAAPAAAAAAASASPQRPPSLRGPFPAPSPGAPAAPPLLPPLHGSGSFRRALSTDQLGAAAAAWAAGGAGGGLGSAPVWTWRGSAQALGERAGSGFSMGSGGGGGEAGDAGGGSTPPPGAPRSPAPPYKLRCVAHSLGGMSMLIHTVNRLREGRPHHIARLLLLTPAGFHEHHPRVTHPVRWALPKLAAFIRSLPGCRGLCFPLYIPTPLARGLVFKLLISLSRIPGLGEALRRMYAFLLDGDVSEWDRALQMPQYGAEDMPAISLDQVLHLIQLAKRHTFQLYDYGSPAANTAHYGTPQPPHVDREYWRLDLPVHLVAGRRDGVIPPANVRRHFEAMRAQGVAVSYREFDFGHLDFTLGVKEEVRMYLMKLLRL